MSRRKLWLAAVVLISLTAAVILLWPKRGTEDDGGESTAETPVEEAELPAQVATVPADLYFPGQGGQLAVERREVPASDLVEEQIATLVEALIAGPQTRQLRSPLPAGVAVRKVYLIEDIVFVDLESAQGSPPSTGSQREMLTVYSLVNTVLANAESAERLVLLWNGQQPVTFAGHLNTAQPLKANFDLVASQP